MAPATDNRQRNRLGNALVFVSGSVFVCLSHTPSLSLTPPLSPPHSLSLTHSLPPRPPPANTQHTTLITNNQQLFTNKVHQATLTTSISITHFTFVLRMATAAAQIGPARWQLLGVCTLLREWLLASRHVAKDNSLVGGRADGIDSLLYKDLLL